MDLTQKYGNENKQESTSEKINEAVNVITNPTPNIMKRLDQEKIKANNMEDKIR